MAPARECRPVSIWIWHAGIRCDCPGDAQLVERRGEGEPLRGKPDVGHRVDRQAHPVRQVQRVPAQRPRSVRLSATQQVDCDRASTEASSVSVPQHYTPRRRRRQGHRTLLNRGGRILLSPQHFVTFCPIQLWPKLRGNDTNVTRIYADMTECDTDVTGCDTLPLRERLP